MGVAEAFLRQCNICGVFILTRIFVCVGSRPYPFDRLFIELDCLCKAGRIRSEVFAQIGASVYKPQHFEYVDFMDTDAFAAELEQADIVISHGASGSIMGALNKEKKVIAVARLERYGEHINNHQVDINKTLASKGLVLAVEEMSDLGDAIERMERDEVRLTPWHNGNQGAIAERIEELIARDIVFQGGVDGI